ncbi:MAG: FAD-binding protein [Betaproteobacteria bacterium]|nr:FAD-binding protein [Betaproteobacteria bacterium]
MHFDESFDVVVAGFGLAGGMAALAAAQSGARTLLLEKSEVPGGLSICSYGAVRSALDFGDAYAYLRASNAGRTPDDVLEALARGMCSIEAQVRDLARINGAVVRSSIEQDVLGDGASVKKRNRGNYPFPGTETFYHTAVVDVPGVDVKQAYPWANGGPGGPMLFKVVHDHVLRAGVELRLASAVTRLIAAPARREVCGVAVSTGATTRRIAARRGVVLACGGFEANAEMKSQFLEGQPMLNAAARCNTGDGIRMAQDLGAKLWHIWHVHGAYGFRHVDPDYPYAIRVKRLPDWFPGEQHEVRLKMPWILLDRSGRRFMSEHQPYTQDTAVRPLQHFDPVTQSFPRNPAYLICDDEGRRMYPLGKPTSNDPGVGYAWSDDNLKEVELGILKRGSSLRELALALGLEPEALEAGVARWNALCDRGVDADFGRPPDGMAPIRTPPFFGAPVWAVISNTQGGPVRDAQCRVIDAYDAPIPRLYSAGELGSAFGHLYLSGGNIAECMVTGGIAGRNAAALPARNVTVLAPSVP